MKISQAEYERGVTYSRNLMAKALSADKSTTALMKSAYPKALGGQIEPKEWSLDHPLVRKAGRAYMKLMYQVMQKAGVNTNLGFNFFDLRGPAYFIFPLLTPFIQEIGKQGAVNAGVGTLAHWKATRNPNSTGVYGGVSEGHRNATATPDEIDYYAIYKELGQEGAETFTAQWAGEGYTDNQADEHFRNLARVRLSEEMMTIGGNSGTGTPLNTGNLSNLGFNLGMPVTPTGTLGAAVTAGLPSGITVGAAVVALTWQGFGAGGQAGYGPPPSVANGLQTNYIRTNADGSTDNVTCGCSIISNVSATVTTNTANQAVGFSTTAIKGAVAYAWYVAANVTANLGNAQLYAITSYPGVTVTGFPAAGAQRGNAAGLSVDNSANTLDYDGLATFSFVNGLWTDMNNASFTPAGNGQVLELESDLAQLFTKYQAQVDAIWCSVDVKEALEAAIIFSKTGTNSYIFTYDRAGQNAGLMGGFVIDSYKSKYSINPEGGNAIPIRLHPMFPPGTMLYDIKQNPYPHSRIPASRQFLVQRDYYAIEWPVTTRQRTFGTYIHQVLAHYVPWITAIRTGIGPFVAPCWIAAAVFEEDFFTGPRVNMVRSWLVNDWEKSGPVAKLVMNLYRRYGQRAAAVIGKNRALKFAFRKLFDRVLAKAQAGS